MNETDRELLELAAKAAGLSEHGWMGDSYCHVVDNTLSTFDPLTDDGDALRLAVKLRITLFQTIRSVIAETDEGFDYKLISKKELCDDETRIAATRRAIVRAAAEIGKGM